MPNDKKRVIYLLVTNHSSLKGCWEQYIITKRTFNFAEDFNLKLSATIVPNEINIIIEEFNDQLVTWMRYVKKKHPKTKYILYVTEYLTPNLLFGFQLNTFSLREKILHTSIAFLTSLGLTKKYTGSSKSYSKKSLPKRVFYKFRNYLSTLSVSPIIKLFGQDAFWNALMLTRREKSLNKAKSLFSLCISTTEAVLYSYDRFCNSQLAYLPVFIDSEKAKNSRKGRCYDNSSFFSGRISSYRSKIIDKIIEIDEAFPLKKLGAHKKSSSSIHQNGLYIDSYNKLKNSPAIESDKCDSFFSPLFNCFDSIYEIDKEVKTPVFEIYIPQLKSWPYSSPNRTMLSIEKGYIPINLGRFEDHDINKYTLQYDDIYELSSHVNSIDINESFEELDNKITEYNKEQAFRFTEFIKIFKPVL